MVGEQIYRVYSIINVQLNDNYYLRPDVDECLIPRSVPLNTTLV